MVVSKVTAEALTKVLLRYLQREQAILLLIEVEHEVPGNQSFRETISLVLENLKSAG